MADAVVKCIREVFPAGEGWCEGCGDVRWITGVVGRGKGVGWELGVVSMVRVMWWRWDGMGWGEEVDGRTFERLGRGGR